MPDIQFVIFDMNDVLYDFDQDVRLELLEALTGRPGTEIKAAVYGGPHENEAEAGEPGSAEEYLAQYGRLLGYPIDFDTWSDIHRKALRARPEVLDLVRRLKQKADVAMLTNNGMMLKAALPVCAPEMIEIFGDRAHVSAEFKVRKPDPLIYKRICGKYGFEPGRSAFIDDKAENVTGAEKAGLIGHVYDTAANFEAFLHAHQLL